MADDVRGPLRRLLATRDLGPGDMPGGKLKVATADDDAARAAPTPAPPRRFARQVNKIADEKDWAAGAELEGWLEGFDALGASYARTEVHRQQWEWAQGLYALRQLGMLREDATALGVGTGAEPMMYLLANQLASVTAVDKYRSPFLNSQYPRMLKDPSEYAKIEYDHDRLRVLHMDATELAFDDESFDIVWGFSTIENIGGHGAAGAAMREMARVVRPGGTLVVSTQLILNGVAHYSSALSLFRRDFFLPDELEEHVVVPALEAGMSLLEEVDLSISDESLADVLNIDNYQSCVNAKPHVVMHQQGSVWTSVVLVFTKPAAPAGAADATA
uniref:Methyltransferase type 11 domain-containing protein n=1 Tax=Bicosoecida sp. CB-2014 TaxID=1486930 RepID=A0A7S1CBU4_9STRA